MPCMNFLLNFTHQVKTMNRAVKAGKSIFGRIYFRLKAGSDCVLSWRPLRVHNIFLFFAITWGSLTVFITPPFQVPDEDKHFLRAYHISTGHIIAETKNNLLGGFLPVNLLRMDSLFKNIRFHPLNKITKEQMIKACDLNLTPENQVFGYFPNSAHYFPIPYLPQAAVITVLRIFNAPPICFLYAGRLGNLLIWSMLIYMSIIFVPFSKWLFTLLALLPMSVFQAASLSPDALTNGLSFLFIALTFRLAFDIQKSFEWRDLLIVLSLSVLLALSKSAYFFLVLLVLLIPSWKFSSRRNYAFSVIIIFVITGIAVLFGSIYIKHVYQSVDMTHGMWISKPWYPQNVHPYKQLDFIVTHEVLYMKTIFHELWLQKFTIAESFIGKLGWMDTTLPGIYIVVAFMILGLVSLADESNKITITPVKRMIILGSLLSVIFIMCTLLYLSWTPVGAFEIRGIEQGRYYIAISPLLFSIIQNRSFKLPSKTLATISVLYIIVSILVMNYALICRYYLSQSVSL